MFTGERRPLPFPLDRSLVIERNTDYDEVCGIPEFPEDSDEKITVFFRLSLNEFVALATAIDVGSDPAFGDDAIQVWYLWVASVMCAAFCDEVAICFENQQERLMDAVAAAIASNPLLQAAIASAISETGGSVPGRPLTTTQAGQNISPPNVLDEEGNCIPDALWGACLYLVQSGNRAITDFFEQTEAASNALETSAIVISNVPAAGGYAASALEFADQIAETLQEGYAGAYTEAYENSLACDIFCLARAQNCEVTPDLLVFVMEQRLGYDPTLDFGVLMARVGTGVFVGGAIADSAFYIYFAALRFGQQFGEKLGFRPLTDLMSLGADQLASDNWEVLCDCPTEWNHTFDFTIDEQGWLIHAPYGVYVPGVGFQSDGQPIAWLYREWTEETTVNAVRFETSAGNQLLAQVGTPEPALTFGVFDQPGAAYTDTTTSVSTGFTDITEIVCRPAVEGVTTWTGTLIRLTLYGTGTEPTW